MRNEPKPLDELTARRVYVLRDALPVGRMVTLHYSKRDGSVSSSTGEVTFHNGREGCDTMSVTVLTADKGARTINLDKVTEVVFMA